jgi:subtilisin family serine protease
MRPLKYFYPQPVPEPGCKVRRYEERDFFIPAWLLLLPVFSFLMVTGMTAEISAAASAGNSDYVAQEILMKFKPGVTEIDKAAVRGMFGAVLVDVIRVIRVERWRLPAAADTLETVARLVALPQVDYAEPNYRYDLEQMPDDPDFGLQWYLHNTGQTVHGRTGAPGADIDAVRAWEITTGSREIVIAVIDSGAAMGHPDLTANIWTNPHEIPGNLEDDDANGYVDDIHGWDFVNNDNKPWDYSRDLYGDGHGTHVAAIIAAAGNNALGITGVMWEARIMPLQVFDLFEDSLFNATSGNIARAVIYAADNGAAIINCSFGGMSFSRSQYDAFSYADEKGVLVVAAAGNDSADNDVAPVYPAGYDLSNIISVAATDEYDALARYSNFGKETVDVAAPGGGSSSTIYSAAPPRRVVVFEENFEVNDDFWVTDASDDGWFIDYWPYFESRVAMFPRGRYPRNASAYWRTRDPIRIKDMKGLTLEFSILYQLTPARDFLFVELSEDGGIFERIHQFSGCSGGIENVVIWSNDLDGDEYFLQFRLASDGRGDFGGVFLNDIRLSGIYWEFAGDEYGYKSGTSMAAPVVSGIAGLILSAAPGLSHREIKGIILDAAVPMAGLSNRVSSGGRVSASGAVVLASAFAGKTDKEDNGDKASPENRDSGGCFIRNAGIESVFRY